MLARVHTKLYTVDLLQDTLAAMGPVTNTTGDASPTGAVRGEGKMKVPTIIVQARLATCHLILGRP